MDKPLHRRRRSGTFRSQAGEGHGLRSEVQQKTRQGRRIDRSTSGGAVPIRLVPFRQRQELRRGRRRLSTHIRQRNPGDIIRAGDKSILSIYFMHTQQKRPPEGAVPLDTERQYGTDDGGIPRHGRRGDILHDDQAPYEPEKIGRGHIRDEGVAGSGKLLSDGRRRRLEPSGRLSRLPGVGQMARGGQGIHGKGSTLSQAGRGYMPQPERIEKLRAPSETHPQQRRLPGKLGGRRIQHIPPLQGVSAQKDQLPAE